MPVALKWNKQTILTITIVVIVMILIVYVYQDHRFKLRPHVKDMWIINLDKDKKRLENIYKRTGHIQEIVHRWPATYGKDLTREQLKPEGVGYAVTRTGNQKDDLAGVLRNAGVVGCWLSHKRLLTHLATLDVPEYYGHLILEDDVDIPADFLKPSDEWHKVYTRVPTDWDMVYFGLTQPLGSPIGERILKASSAKPGHEGNWGTQAYMVRHGSIKTKILPALEYMTDAIDEQYNDHFNEWNVYVVEPAIIKLDTEMSADSSLLKVNAGVGDDIKMSY